MCKEQLIEYLESKTNVNKQLVHASNMLSKLCDNKQNKIDALLSLGNKYAEYIEAQNELIGWSDDIIEKRVCLLNDYYFFYDSNPKYAYNKLFSSQGKLRPTILEEFMYFLFRDYINQKKIEFGDDNNKIELGGVKAYCNIYFSPTGFNAFVKNASVKLNVKDQDFAIFRKVKFDVEDYGELTASVPIIATEVKTYIDKTMLESVIATAEKLKRGNPQSHTVVVTETYQVKLEVDISYTDIDQIYVLRKSRDKHSRKPIDANVVKKLFNDVRMHIEAPWADTKKKLITEGVIL